MPRRRTEQIEQAQKERYLRALGTVGTLTAGCKAARVSPHTVYAWREHDTAFSVAEHEAREACADEIEAALVRRAKRRSDVAAIFLLKGLRPEKYADRWVGRLGGDDGAAIPVRVVDYREDLAAVTPPGDGADAD